MKTLPFAYRFARPCRACCLPPLANVYAAALFCRPPELAKKPSFSPGLPFALLTVAADRAARASTLHLTGGIVLALGHANVSLCWPVSFSFALRGLASEIS